MKNAIFQYYLSYNGVGKHGAEYPDTAPDWAQRSVSYFSKYAEKHGVDYYYSTDRFVDATDNHFEALRTYKDPMFDKYDKVLYVDVDVMPKNMEANIFDIDVIDIAGWSEWKHPDLAVSVNYRSAAQAIKRRYTAFGAPMVNSSRHPSDIRMLNTGVLLWSKEGRLKARDNFDDHEKWFNYQNPLLDSTLDSKVVGHSSLCLDQVYLNAMLNKFKFNVTELSMEWNRLPTKDENRSCNFAHYLGSFRPNLVKIFKELE